MEQQHESGAPIRLLLVGCASEVRVFCSEAILRTGVWGRRLEIQYHGSEESEMIETERSKGVWEQFLAVRSGAQPNPCPPEVGLQMARLWDLIVESDAKGGIPVAC